MIPVPEPCPDRLQRKPRASGDDPVVCPLTPDESRVNPARAGMILKFSTMYGGMLCKPRASGDDPDRGGAADAQDP